MQRRAAVLFSALLIAVIVFTAWLALAGGTYAAPIAGEEDAWRCWAPDPQPADPCGRQINDIHMLSPTDGWAVGDRGLLLHWDGLAWTPFPAAAGADLVNVHLAGPDAGWAVGGSETTATILWWDGVGWQGNANLPLHLVVSLDVLAPDDIWAAGRQNYIFRYDGAVWHEIPTPTAGAGVLHDIEVAGPNDGWTVGWNSDGPVSLHWDGLAWQKVPIPRNAWQVEIVSLLWHTDLTITRVKIIALLT